MTTRNLLLAIVVLLGGTAVAASPAGAGGGCHQLAGEGVTRGSGETVQLARNCFAPNVLEVEPGTTVTFANGDGVEHNVTSVSWQSDTIPPGGTFDRRFDEAGTFPFSCTLHPGMTGAVVVAGAGGEEAAAPQPVSTTGDADGPVTTGTAIAVAAIAAAGGFAGGRTVRRRR